MVGQKCSGIHCDTMSKFCIGQPWKKSTTKTVTVEEMEAVEGMSTKFMSWFPSTYYRISSNLIALRQLRNTARSLMSW